MRLQIRLKLVVAFLAVGLLSIVAGVFVPLWIIARMAPREGREFLNITYNNIYRYYMELVNEPGDKISPLLNKSPDFIRDFKSQDHLAVYRRLQMFAADNNYLFVRSEEGFPELAADREPRRKVRFLKILIPNILRGISPKEYKPKVRRSLNLEPNYKL